MPRQLFKEGNKGGPGRPKGSVSDFTIAKRMIFEVFSQEKNQKQFRAKMQELCTQNPVAFYLKFIQPIQPKDNNITFGEGNLPVIQFITKKAD